MRQHLTTRAIDQRVSRSAVVVGPYRYLLTRVVCGSRLPRLLGFVMLNPSVADWRRDDPTIRRCHGFAAAMGYDGVCVTNLYPWRATEPRDLARRTLEERLGDRNDDFIKLMVNRVKQVVVAWGQRPSGLSRHEYHARVRQVLTHLKVECSVPVILCLGLTQEGYPRHPLMLPKSTTVRPYEETP